MKSPANDNLKKEFERQFNNARKQSEAELKQKPFGALIFLNANGEPIHAIRMCLN